MKHFVPVLLLLALSMTACVSKKKYEKLDALKSSAQQQLAATKSELKAERAENEALRDSLDQARQKISSLEEELALLRTRRTDLADQLNGAKADMKALEAQCEQTKENYEQLKDKSTRKMKDLVKQLEDLQADLGQREARLAEVEAAMNRQDSLMQSLRKRLADALLGFEEEGLTVEVRNGKVYVSLSNKLLFASGSTKIDTKGQQALKGLAEVIADDPDLNIMVEGHTDDVPVSNLGAIKDNWDLSVMRSTEVVRYLVQYGVAPTRVIPSGRSEYIPKEKGKSAAVRAANRRTEIVLSPKLDQLYELVNGN